jgi:hypothetical protein
MRVYLVLCVASFLTGYGILALLGLARKWNGALLAAPGVALSILVIVVGNGLWLGASVPALATLIAIAALVFGAAGALDLVKAPPRWGVCVVALVAVACPLIALATFFRWGLTHFAGSWFYDGWSYVVIAQAFIDRFSPGADEFMTSLYALGFWQTETRYIASGTIAVLSVLARGVDAHGGYGPLIALSVLVFVSACGFLAIARERTAAVAVVYLAFAATGCWLLGIVQANNLDSLLVFALAPLLMALARVAAASDLRGASMFGLVLAALLWSQVELFPIAAAPAGLQLAWRIWSSREAWRGWALWTAVTGGFAIAVAAVWIWPAVRFFMGQFKTAQVLGTQRPGFGFFSGLFDAKCRLSAAWGFWGPGETCTPDSLTVVTIIAVVFSACLAGGAVFLIRQRDYVPPLALALLLAGAAHMLWGLGYDYGAYKFLSTGWFLAALVMVEGCVAAAAMLRATPAVSLSLVFLLLCGPQSYVLYQRLEHFNAMHPDKTLAPYRKAAGIRELVGSDPVAVAMRDGLAAQWFVFTMRDLKLTVVNRPHSYFVNFENWNVMRARRLRAASQLRWVVTDLSGDLSCRNFRQVWQDGPYRLWRSDDPSSIFAAELAKQPVAAELPELACDSGAASGVR